MKKVGEDRTVIIGYTRPSVMVVELNKHGFKEGHFTDTEFLKAEDEPMLLASYKRVTDLHSNKKVPLIVALNSDQSLRDFYLGKPNEAELKANHIPQNIRAKKVVSLLSECFPDRKIAVVFFNEPDAYELYKSLNFWGMGMRTVHKTGLDVKQQNKPVIGGGFFDYVFAWPHYTGNKPLTHVDREKLFKGDRKPHRVEDLTKLQMQFNSRYISKEGALLFKLPKKLKHYGPRDDKDKTGHSLEL
jgi:hypothetical protein